MPVPQADKKVHVFGFMLPNLCGKFPCGVHDKIGGRERWTDSDLRMEGPQFLDCSSELQENSLPICKTFNDTFDVLAKFYQ